MSEGMDRRRSGVVPLAARRCALVALLLALGCGGQTRDDDREPTRSTGGQAATGGQGGAAIGGQGGAAAAGAPAGGAPQPGGSGNTPACETHEDCILAHFDEPYVCRHGRCLGLLSAECPVLLGAGADLENLKESEPLVFGAYSALDGPLHAAVSRYNYELAIEEFNDATGGLRGGPDGTRHPLIALVCSSLDDDLTPSLDHLVTDLDVPGIVAALTRRKLRSAFRYVHGELGAPVLFLSPFEGNTALRELNDDDLLWHLIAGYEQLAAEYTPLVARAEAYQNALRPDPSLPLKVLLIESNDLFNQELAELVARGIVFNGSGALDAANANQFTRLRVGSGDATAELVAAIDPDDPPHVVLLLTEGEFLDGGLEAIELRLSEGTGEPRPLYLASPSLASDPRILTLAQDPGLPALANRVLGVNFASGNPPLYEAYQSRLMAAFPTATVPLQSTENYYDAAYFMMYAFAAAGELRHYDGDDLLGGMMRLIRADIATEPCRAAAGCFEIDPLSIPSALSYLQADPGGSGIALVGTMGPPLFDLSSGERLMPSSIWCVAENRAGELQFVDDALGYDPFTKELTGDFPCFEGF